jgi:hypothetical protein
LAGCREALAELETLGELLAGFCLELGLHQASAGARRPASARFDLGEELADGLGAHLGGEGVGAVLLLGVAELEFGEELLAP